MKREEKRKDGDQKEMRLPFFIAGTREVPFDSVQDAADAEEKFESKREAFTSPSSAPPPIIL